MSRTAVLYHAHCPDGFTAAWIAYNALTRRSGEPVAAMHPVAHGNPPPDLDGIDEVYLVDFAYDHDILVALTDHGRRRVVVLDHHRSAIDDICNHHSDFEGEAPWGDGSRGDGYVVRYSRWYETVLDTNRSGAGITWDYFHPGEPRPPVVDYVEDRDLWRFALPWSMEASAFIRTQPYAFDSWDHLADLSAKEMSEPGHGVLLHINAYCRAAANHAYWCEMGGRRFPIVNVTYESCSEVAAYLLDQFETDMAGYFFERGEGGWQYGFRSRNGVTVHDLAQQYGGGGHEQASGCVTSVLAHERVLDIAVKLSTAAGGAT